MKLSITGLFKRHVKEEKKPQNIDAGQEKEPATYRLAKMNLALRGISHNLGEEADSSFTHDLHMIYTRDCTLTILWQIHLLI